VPFLKLKDDNKRFSEIVLNEISEYVFLNILEFTQMEKLKNLISLMS
jgi:hypothetical protein